MILEKEVVAVAEAFLQAQETRGFRYELASVGVAQHAPGEWVVAYHVATPGGVALEGPVIVVVDETTNTANFL